MRQAIVTKYIGPTNFRGSRIVAKAAAGRVTVPYAAELDQDGAHAKGAEALIRKWEWYGEWFAGGNPDGSGNTYVMREFKSDGERRAFRNRKLVIIRS